MALVVSSCGSNSRQVDLNDGAEIDAEISRCLSDAGYGTSLENVDVRRQEDPEFEAALNDCASTIGVELPPPGEITRQLDASVLEVVECLRDAGWDIPEPSEGEDGGLTLDGVDANVPVERVSAFDSDFEMCTGTPWLPTSPGST
jgi:hypothetical protein